MEEKIKEIVIRRTKRWKTGAMICLFITWLLIMFFPLFKNQKSPFDPMGLVCGVILMVLFVFLYWAFSKLITLAAEVDVRYGEQTSYVLNKLEGNKKKEVKNKAAQYNSFVYDLEEKGKFYAAFDDASTNRVLITYIYNDEKLEHRYEILHSADVCTKYDFVEDL